MNDLLKEHDPPSNLFPLSRLLFLRKPMIRSQTSKLLNIFREEHWIMKQFLMTFVAKNNRLSFCVPRANFKDALSLGTLAVL
ncbi:MAG: hypothetical protein A2075_23885 [Geobacteraceae bacterium GWC2_58_44]|nr:MAG: hypothetical protein A2075_23885 [Geobacteraceae bacterium GWC2_58_44]